MKPTLERPPSACWLTSIKARISKLALVVLGLSTCVAAQTPDGFHWVDFRQEASTVSKIEKALNAEKYTAIREVGIFDGFALVMTVQREPTQPTPMGDEWRVYNVSMKNWSIQALLDGYNLEIKDWLRFQPLGARDLGVVYMDCWECEPASVFTALHYESRTGWRARWSNEKDPSHPGITMRVTDVGDPYTNEDVDQVFAVLAPREGIASVGTWYRSKDLSTGKITEAVSKFFVNQSTGKEKSAQLTGPQATAWEARLCKAARSAWGLSAGASSNSCKRVLRAEQGANQ